MPDSQAPNPVELIPNPNRMQLTWRGHTVADTNRALTVREIGHADMQYIPLADVDTTFLRKTDHHTTCSRKGMASYYSLVSGDTVDANAVWTYDDPIAAVLGIAGYVAFYPKFVELTQSPPD